MMSESELNENVNQNSIINGHLSGIAKWKFRNSRKYPNSIYLFNLKGALTFSGITREVEMIGEKDGNFNYKGYFTIKQPDGELRGDFVANEYHNKCADYKITSTSGIFSSLNDGEGLILIHTKDGENLDEFAWDVTFR